MENKITKPSSCEMLGAECAPPESPVRSGASISGSAPIPAKDEAGRGCPRGNSPPRHGTLRILAFFAFFAVLLVAVDSAVNYGLRRINTSRFGVSNQVMTGQVNADIVINGSSRALTHYDPRIIERITGHSAFNIGRNGSQTDMQLAFLRAYLAHNRKPKLIIQNLDLFSFVTSREIYDPAQYMPYLKDEAIYAGIRQIYPYAWKWRYLPLYGYVVEDMRFTWILGLSGLAGFQTREDHFQGFLPRRTSWTGDFEKFRASVRDGVCFEIEPRGVRDLAGVAEVCRERGVPLLFVYSPEFAEMQILERNRAEVFAKFREICKKCSVSLWDYSDSPICRDRGLFYNSQHLNINGATVFSEALAQKLRGVDFTASKWAQ